jgi:hypothetical protein
MFSIALLFTIILVFLVSFYYKCKALCFINQDFNLCYLIISFNLHISLCRASSLSAIMA